MYRPNRIGPWPLIDLSQAAVNIPTSGGNGTIQGWGNVYGINEYVKVIPTQGSNAGIVADEIATVTARMKSNAQAELTQNKIYALGIVVDGTHHPEEKVQYSVSGAFSLEEDNVSETEFFMARLTPLANGDSPEIASYAGNIDNQIRSSVIIPGAQSHSDSQWGSPDINQATKVGSCGTSVVEGQWGVTEQLQTPVVFGLKITVPNGDIILNIRKLEISLSLHKYRQDLIVFDPTR